MMVNLKITGLAIFLLCIFSNFAFAQAVNHISVIGKFGLDLEQSSSHENWEDYTIFIPQINSLFAINNQGAFQMDVPYDRQLSCYIKFKNDIIDSFKLATYRKNIDLGIIPIKLGSTINHYSKDEMTTHTIEPQIIEIEESSYLLNQSASKLSSNLNGNPFYNASQFNWSKYGFRPRGIRNSNQDVLLNSISMIDPHTGNSTWMNWYGLHELFKQGSTAMGLAFIDEGIAGMNGKNAYEINPLNNSKVIKINYSLSNKSFDHRIGFNYHSGMSKKGWAYSMILGSTWATQTYIPGVFISNQSGYFGIAKQFQNEKEIILNILATKTNRGKAGNATDYVYELTQNKWYNPNWGYYNNTIVNARQQKSLQPIFNILFKQKNNANLQWYHSFSYQFGEQQNTFIDYYNATDPRADYYRNLPDFINNSNPTGASEIENHIKQNPKILQVNWDQLMSSNQNNYETINNINGMPNNYKSGYRSLYVWSADCEFVNKLNYVQRINWKQNAFLKHNGGLSISLNHAQWYRKLNNLLGGDYFVNYNMFAEQQFSGNNTIKQQDLNAPNRAVIENEKYAYHYKTKVQKNNLWWHTNFSKNRFELHVGAELFTTSYQRNGLYKNGLFQEFSFGKSATIIAINNRLKAGISYAINSKNHFSIFGYNANEMPLVNNVFISPRTRNQIVDNIKKENTKSLEAGYTHNSKYLQLHVLVYRNSISNQTLIQRFYNDDPEYKSFINFIFSNLHTVHTGIEFASSVSITKHLSFNNAIHLSQSFYGNNPEINIYADNDSSLKVNYKTAYIKDYFLGGNPQNTYLLGIQMKSNNFWNVGVNWNGFYKNYVTINAAKRTTDLFQNVQNDNALTEKIFGQELLPHFNTIDINIGKSIRFKINHKKNNTYLNCYVYIGINNALNRTIKSFGYEQLRFDYTNLNPNIFPNKYIYAAPRTFITSLSFKI
jgi:hypothetical protein